MDHLVKASNWLVSQGRMKPLDYKTVIYPDLLREVKPAGVNFKPPK